MFTLGVVVPVGLVVVAALVVAAAELGLLVAALDEVDVAVGGVVLACCDVVVATVVVDEAMGVGVTARIRIDVDSYWLLVLRQVIPNTVLACSLPVPPLQLGIVIV